MKFDAVYGNLQVSNLKKFSACPTMGGCAGKGEGEEEGGKGKEKKLFKIFGTT